MNFKYLVIGSGRMALHFSHHLSSLGYQSLKWSRNNHSDFNTFSTIKAPLDRLKATAREATHVLLLISDSQLEAFYHQHKSLFENKVVTHFSGATVVPGVQSCHPLMTFTTELYEKTEYEQIPFILEKGPLEFENLLPGLKNEHYSIHSDQKPLYHSLCVSGGNFTNMLWQAVFVKSINELGLPQKVFIPFLHKVIHNLLANPTNSLTGPLQRKDNLTIETNLKALQGSALQDIYKGFIRLNEELQLNNSYLTKNQDEKRTPI